MRPLVRTGILIVLGSLVSVPLAHAAAWLFVSGFGVSDGAPNQGVMLLAGIGLQVWNFLAAVAVIVGGIVIAIGSYTPPTRDDSEV